MSKLALFFVGVASICAAPALAHHSFAMFDMTRTVTFQGTVKEVQWTNPHVWVEVTAREKSGKTVQWSIEAANVAALKRIGWTKDKIKAGDTGVFVVNPARAGGNRASFASVTLANGQTVEMRGSRVPPSAYTVEGK